MTSELKTCFTAGGAVHWIGDCITREHIACAVHALMESANLPAPLTSRIVIKPNLNNDLSALSGNSTDLRVLAALIEELNNRGYRNITLADGPNIGTFRKSIDVFERLGVSALAKHMDVELVDLNRAPAREIRVATGPVHIAQICLDADILISVPKIKTHAEAGLSAAVKNLMGCVTGTDKWLMHADLTANLMQLNRILKPHFIILDGLFAMEGNGPGDGTPVRLDLLMAGSDPFKLDLAAAHMIGLDWNTIPCLSMAYTNGLLDDSAIAEAKTIERHASLAPAPPRGTLTRFLDRRSLKPLRDITRPIHRSESVRKILYRLGILQDVYEKADALIERLHVESSQCTRCGLCRDYCPLSLPVSDTDFDFQKSACIKCLYCADVCPSKAIHVDGNLGYRERHNERFAERIREAAQSGMTDKHKSDLPRKIRILGVGVVPLRADDLIRLAVGRASAGIRTTICYVNIHVLNISHKDTCLENILNASNVVYCDGEGVRLGARINGIRLPERMTGADWIEPLCTACAQSGASLFLLGGAEGVAERAAKRLLSHHPTLKITGTHSGYFVKENASMDVVRQANESGADILLVGMGTPTQERWIADNRQNLRAPVVWAVGALFDFVAGVQPRGPKWMRDNGLEWLYRLYSDPFRLGRRYLAGIPLFFIRVFLFKLSQHSRISTKAGSDI